MQLVGQLGAHYPWIDGIGGFTQIKSVDFETILRHRPEVLDGILQQSRHSIARHQRPVRLIEVMGKNWADCAQGIGMRHEKTPVVGL